MEKAEAAVEREAKARRGGRGVGSTGTDDEEPGLISG